MRYHLKFHARITATAIFEETARTYSRTYYNIDVETVNKMNFEKVPTFDVLLYVHFAPNYLRVHLFQKQVVKI